MKPEFLPRPPSKKPQLNKLGAIRSMGNQKMGQGFTKVRTEYLRKMNVDEQHNGDNVFVGTLRMHMDEGTKMQWSAREESGERLTYQNLIEELQLRHGLRSEAHKKQEGQAFRLRYEGSLNRTGWDTFLIRFESQARELNISESEKVQQFISVLPTGLQTAIYKERNRVYRT